ncbi:MAG: hypothetical protein GWN01_04200, partial [Nitrosopumilaceae archaeon]|nr:hypothetical protein [Nitrosopumilaceae archaeon]NIU86559.1 hypothetical protein [Nitrosopumilaceae archaeon]NIX60756.1 hypothetical protein [Nitrosopumilaceae archaeon]
TDSNVFNLSTNALLYSTGSDGVASEKKRLYTILPCDHGNWDPNFETFLKFFRSSRTWRSEALYKNDLENKSLGLITLRNYDTGLSLW